MQFHPFPMLSGPHQQTLAGWAFNMPIHLDSEMDTVVLPDGDMVTCEVTTPESWEDHNPTVILLHGLCGSHESPFIVRLAKRLVDSGIRAVRANMRGCGSGAPFARKIYHCGRSEDFFPIVQQIKTQAPNSPLYVVGFSLGGNIILKCAGERADAFAEMVELMIGVCPATDILASSRMLALPKNKMYQDHFVTLLKAQLQQRQELYPDIPHPDLPEKFTLFEFDQLFTAPQCGFRSALDYYRKASSCHVIKDIQVPTHILFAADDPFIDWTSLNSLSLPSSMRVHLTKYGGHMGYVGHPLKTGGYRWMDSTILHWINEHQIALTDDFNRAR